MICNSVFCILYHKTKVFENFHKMINIELLKKRQARQARHVIIDSFVPTCTLTLRCNICSQEIDEKELESHLNTLQHKDNKTRLGEKIDKGSDASVVKVWLSSFNKD